MVVDELPAFHLCPRQEKGESQMANDAAALSTLPLLGSFLGSLTQELCLMLYLLRIVSHGLSYCYG